MARPVNPLKSLFISGAIGRDGQALKTLSLGEFDALMEARAEGTGDAWALYKVVPWVYRCTMLRAQAVSAMPYVITETDTGKVVEWEIADQLPRLLWLTEASLCLSGAAYWLKQYNRVALKGLKWLAAATMHWDADEVNGLNKFTRKLGSSAPLEWAGETGSKKLSDIVYFWLPDPAVELGPGTPPAMVAAVAAGLSRDSLEFAAAFFKRGAIPAVILSVEGNPKPEELEKLESRWDRFFGGVRRAWGTAAVAVASSFKPVVVGAYPKDLAMPGLEGIVRQQVAAAMGVRPTMVEQAANFATAKVDRLSFYQDTIIPECGFLEAELNRQLFKPMGMEIRFTPETLDIMQEEEAERADALVKLTTAGLPLDLAMQMLGYELPEGYSYEEMKREAEGLVKARQSRAAVDAERDAEREATASGGEGAAAQGQGGKPVPAEAAAKPEQAMPVAQGQAVQGQAGGSEGQRPLASAAAKFNPSHDPGTGQFAFGGGGGSVGGGEGTSGEEGRIDFSKKLSADQAATVRSQFASEKKALAENLGMEPSAGFPGRYSKNVDYSDEGKAQISIGSYASEGHVPRYTFHHVTTYSTALGGNSMGGKYQFNNRQNWERFTEYTMKNSGWRSVSHLASELPGYEPSGKSLDLEVSEVKAAEPPTLDDERAGKLPPAIEAEAEITEEDIDAAIAEWRKRMPEKYKDLLNAEAA